MTADWFEKASKRRKWLVGVSGGADSVALLHLMVEHGFSKLVVCHLDHRLRGRASTGDAKFVEKLAAKLGVAFEGGRADVNKLADRLNQSLETAARNARHEFFRSCAREHRCEQVVLAHHADDQAETVLWNLLRGSHGLRGMQEKQTFESLEFHRPVLKWRHAELCEYLSSRRLKWREDATNGEPIAVRNRLRNEALPLLAEISGRDPTFALVRGAVVWDEHHSIIDWALEKADVIDPQGRLHVSTVKKMPLALQRAAIVNYFSKRSIAADSQLVHSALTLFESNDRSVINLPGGKRFRRREGRAFVE